MKTQQLSGPLTVDDGYAKQIDRVARDTLKNTLGVKFGASVLPGLNRGSGNAEDEYVLSAGKAVHALFDDRISSPIPNYLKDKAQNRYKAEFRKYLSSMFTEMVYLEKTEVSTDAKTLRYFTFLPDSCLVPL